MSEHEGLRPLFDLEAVGLDLTLTQAMQRDTGPRHIYRRLDAMSDYPTAADRENGSGREHRGAMCWCGRDHRFTSDPNRENGSAER